MNDRGVLEVLVYAPRDEAEVQVVKELVVASITYASNNIVDTVVLA